MNPNTRKSLPGIRSIKLPQRNIRNPHLIRFLASQKPKPEHLEPMRRRHLVQFFVDRANQNLPPEPVDRLGRLLLLAQPIEHRNAIQIRAPTLPFQSPQPSSKRNLIAQTQTTHSKKRPREMQRLRQAPRAQNRSPPARFKKVKFFMKSDVAVYIQPPVQIQKIH